jgi:hypothetical protein
MMEKEADRNSLRRKCKMTLDLLEYQCSPSMRPNLFQFRKSRLLTDSYWAHNSASCGLSRKYREWVDSMSVSVAAIMLVNEILHCPIRLESASTTAICKMVGPSY